MSRDSDPRSGWGTGSTAMSRAGISFATMLFVVCAVLLGGCASSETVGGAPSAPPTRDGSTTVVVPGLEIVARSAPARFVDGRDLQPRADTQSEWKILSSTGSAYGTPGETLVIRARIEASESTMLLVEEGADQTLHISGAERGAPVMPVTDAYAEQSVSRFDPPLVLGQPEISASDPVFASSAMVVESMEKPGHERDRGTATRTLRLLADETIRTPLGDLRCQRLEIEFIAKLRFATATVKTTRWILPGVGPVAEDERERIVILGLIPRESTRVMVRTTPLPAATD